VAPPLAAETPAGPTVIAVARTAQIADDVTSLCLNTLPSCVVVGTFRPIPLVVDYGGRLLPATAPSSLSWLSASSVAGFRRAVNVPLTGVKAAVWMSALAPATGRPES